MLAVFIGNDDMTAFRANLIRKQRAQGFRIDGMRLEIFWRRLDQQRYRDKLRPPARCTGEIVGRSDEKITPIGEPAQPVRLHRSPCPPRRGGPCWHDPDDSSGCAVKTRRQIQAVQARLARRQTAVTASHKATT